MKPVVSAVSHDPNLKLKLKPGLDTLLVFWLNAGGLSGPNIKLANSERTGRTVLSTEAVGKSARAAARN